MHILLATGLDVHFTCHRTWCTFYLPQDLVCILLATGLDVHFTCHRTWCAFYLPQDVVCILLATGIIEQHEFMYI